MNSKTAKQVYWKEGDNLTPVCGLTIEDGVFKLSTKQAKSILEDSQSFTVMISGVEPDESENS